MHLLKHRSMVFYLGFILILMMAIGGMAMGAFADGPVTTAVINGNPNSFGEAAPSTEAATPVTLNGLNQTTTYSMPVTVTDPRGGGLGWNLTIGSTQFTSGSHTLDAGDTNALVILTEPLKACGSGSTCTLPTNSVVYGNSGISIPTDGSSAKFYNAALNTGMGVVVVTPTVTVEVPGSAFAGSYTSTVTLTLTTAP